ncbi:MAG TPA: TetR family transcriptional regulator, partial [Solirubrobacterales bacterium]|nr:TetR family transcriptional regulator [Solirubrobacterales bacterium]
MPEPPKQARGVEKRERLYAAALARFERDGVAETRVEDVIADVEVSWATFFRYFPRKEDVLIEAIARHFREHAMTLAGRARADRRARVR